MLSFSRIDELAAADYQDENGKYSVFHGIGNQEQGCCELVLGFQKAQGASL